MLPIEAPETKILLSTMRIVSPEEKAEVVPVRRFTPRDRAHVIHGTEGWVGPRASLHAVVKGKISALSTIKPLSHGRSNNPCRVLYPSQILKILTLKIFRCFVFLKDKSDQFCNESILATNLRCLSIITCGFNL